MTPANAIKLVRQLQRYRTSECSVPYRKGFFVKQMLLPRVTKAEEAAATKLVKGRTRVRKIWVPISEIRSTQGCLSVPRMVYQLRRHPLKDIPLVIKLPGRRGYLLWDGNHRTASATLLGKRRMRCTEILACREFT